MHTNVTGRRDGQHKKGKKTEFEICVCESVCVCVRGGGGEGGGIVKCSFLVQRSTSYSPDVTMFVAPV